MSGAVSPLPYILLWRGYQKKVSSLSLFPFWLLFPFHKKRESHVAMSVCVSAVITFELKDSYETWYGQ
jgi:hypothetical protein